ncbi:unnamed protein product [Sphagnum jensenii]|uniref:Uncharacterized protein n=1 Tax=Sphagnum jensenii TaxID=128206 RepID=A0ABP1BM63_9BRYO
MCNTDDDHLGLSFQCSFFVKQYSYGRTTTMADEWDFQRIRRFMEEQAAMPASSVLYMNAADLIRNPPAAPRGTCSSMASQVAGTNSRLKAPAAATLELQPVQQSPSKNGSFEVPAADQSKLIFQQTVRAPTFTELVVQASACVEEIRHDLQQDGAIIPAMLAVKRYKMSSSAEKLFNQQTVATALREADQAHGNPLKRSGKAVYRKQLQQLQTDHEEPNLELRLGNGHLHNADVQGRTFLYSRGKELQLQRAAATAYPISYNIPIEVPRRNPNEFRYRVESRGSVLQQVASGFSRPAAAAPPPIIGSTSTAMLLRSSRAAVREHSRLAEPNQSTAQLEVLKDGARAVALRSYRQQLIMTRSASSSEMPIVLPPVPAPYTTTESYKGPPHPNCSPTTTTISNRTIIRHPASVIMGTMGPPPPPLMMMSSMGPPPLPEILGPAAAQAQPSVISIPFPQGRPLPSSPRRDVSLSAAPPHSGQQEEVANRAALVQIPGRSRNSAVVAAAAATVVVGNVPDFCVTLTKFAVDWSDAENHNQQQQVQLVSRI